MLDSEEYLHLAVHAAQQELHHSAMEYLYKSLSLAPENANAIFLLAAEHAELGLYGRAIEGMKKSIALDSKLEMAYYQLALLYIQQGENTEAYPLWVQLAGHAIDPVVREFAQAMLLCDTEPQKALSHMDNALALPQKNDFLQKSIRGIADSLRAVFEIQTSNNPQSETAAHEILVNTYKDASFSRDDSE